MAQERQQAIVRGGSIARGRRRARRKGHQLFERIAVVGVRRSIRGTASEPWPSDEQIGARVFEAALAPRRRADGRR